MTWGAVAIAGSTIVGGLMSSSATKNAANTAANAQVQAAQLGIDQQDKQFQAIQQLLSPFVVAGHNSLFDQQTLLGMHGDTLQQGAIDQLQKSPAFTSQLQLGENRILANASATGGLRGGNTQAALAQFAPQLLAQQIDAQYGRLGGITALGQNAAAGVGNAGMQVGNSISSLLMAGGNAQANGALLGGVADARLGSTISGALGQYLGKGGTFGFGGAGGGVTPPNPYVGGAGNGFIADDVPMTGFA
jgi:hypothetical protein